MIQILNWAGEHPILAILILLILTGTVVKIIRLASGAPESCEHNCDCDEEDESDSDQLP